MRCAGWEVANLTDQWLFWGWFLRFHAIFALDLNGNVLPYDHLLNCYFTELIGQNDIWYAHTSCCRAQLFHCVDLAWFNWSSSSDAYVCQWIGSAWVQIMACRLFCTKPLSKLTLGYCQYWKLRNKLSQFFIKIQKISFTKMRLKMSSVKWQPSCPGGDELVPTEM